VGRERLIAGALVVLVACARSGATSDAAKAPVEVRVRHAQIVRAKTVQDRLALFERFRAKNGEAWRIVDPEHDVDGIRLFLRHALRRDRPGPEVELDHRIAAADAVAFVSSNAELLGLGAPDVAVLEVTSAAIPFEDAVTPAGRYVVHMRAHIAMRGYEAFESLASKIDITVFVDADRQIRFFTNDSRIHPRLAIDTKPLLEPEDALIVKNVVGRELFVAIDDPRNPNARVRELRRESVGHVRDVDIIQRHLTVWASPGPFGAYTSFTLAYVVQVGLGGYMFRFVVDADTGALLDDAAVPVVGRGGMGPEGEL
jgi:hypothetical protein